MTEPSGIYRLQANAIGRSSKTVREFLEKNHRDEMTRDEAIKLTVKSLLEVVQTGAKNIEISVMESYGKVTNLDLSQVEAIVSEIEREKEAVHQQRPNANDRVWPQPRQVRQRWQPGFLAPLHHLVP
ncbi:20S proteasome subunit alpha 4 [Rhizoctonia solani AG-1 IB]|uniref:20S proteasome subunit alpha 4 n=1 Tax=Thanatephorus cucumeris (strain AG1-IB / isolate 7/3/14) TaxID=1108050 RepID=M5BRF5_THACB|nr:20S proteasome subunit alpha 4 [Rhizoctonia solani AG-1 IB]